MMDKQLLELMQEAIDASNEERLAWMRASLWAKRMGWTCAVLGVVLFVLSVSNLWSIYTGACP